MERLIAQIGVFLGEDEDEEEEKGVGGEVQSFLLSLSSFSSLLSSSAPSIYTEKGLGIWDREKRVRSNKQRYQTN